MRLSQLAAVACLLIAAQVQSQTPEICNAAFASGIRDNYSVLSEREQYESYQRRLCDAKYTNYASFTQSAAGMKLDLPVAEGLIGLSGNSEQKSAKFQVAYTNYCESTYFTSQYRERFASYSSQVSTALTSSWLECQKVHVNAWLQANQKGVFIAVTPQENFADFTVSVYRKGSVELRPVRVNDMTPAGSFSCVRENIPFKAGSQVAKNEFLFTCSKPPQKQISFAIDTSDGVSNTVIIPGNASKLAELNDRISTQFQSLRTEITSLRQELGRSSASADEARSALSGQLQQLSTQTSNTTGELLSSIGQLNQRPKLYTKVRLTNDSCTNFCKSGSGGAANGFCVAAYSNNQSASCEKRDTPMYCVCLGDPQTPH